MLEDISGKPKLLFWGSFLGTIAIVIIIAIVIYVKDQGRVADLAKLFPDWGTVNGKIASFEARMPGRSEYAAQDVPIAGSDQKMRQEIFVSGDKRMSYFVSATRYPAQATGDEEQNLRQSLDGMIKAIPGGQVISSSYHAPFSGANYLEFKAYGTGNSTSYKGRLFLDAQSLYEIYISYPKDFYNDAAYTYFVNSFALKQ